MTHNKKLSYRPDIQGIRAISIILVVLNHAGLQFLPGGFVGVDVFFVLSGYLITGLLVREHNENNKINMLDFYARRLKRLFPALFIMLVTVVVCSSLLLSDFQLTQQAASVNFATTWSSNLFFSFTTIEYFAELKNKDLFLHTWSLGVEEQFYLIWPILIVLSFLFCNKIDSTGRWELQFIGILVFLFLFSFGLSQYWKVYNPIFSFYMMPSRIWQFALGALCYIWLEKNRHRFESWQPLYLPSFWKNSAGLIGIGLIIGSAAFFHSSMTYPGAWALLPSIGALLLISARYVNQSNVISRTLTHPSLVWIGDRSYSWYLWHWPVLMIGSSIGIASGLDKVTGLVTFSFLMAVFSYRYIELPFWKGRFSNAKPRLVILTSLLAMLLLVFGFQNYLKSARNKSETQAASFVNKARADLPIIYSMGCDAWYANSNVQPCLFGDNNHTKTVALIGDSVLAQWFSLLPQIFRYPEWRTIVLTKSACPMVDEDFFYTRIGKVYTICAQWRDASLEYLNSLRPDIIIAGNAATYDFSENQWIAGSKRVFSRLSQMSKNVIILPGTYALSFDGPSCLEQNLSSILGIEKRDPQICAEPISNAEQINRVVGYLNRATDGLPNVKLLNLNDLECPDTQCSALNANDLVVFRDSQHLTDTFVRAQVPFVRSRIERLGIEVSP
ncbi:acyltransferase family protein [Methylomonas sp. MgM2]